MTRRVGVLLVGALLVCGCRRDDASSQPPQSSVGSDAIDLLAKPSVTVTTELGVGRPFVRQIYVWAPSTVTITVTHASGSLGPFTLSIHDALRPDIPLGRDSMTCQAPGCTMRADIAVMPGTTALILRVDAVTTLAVTIAVAAVADAAAAAAAPAP